MWIVKEQLNGSEKWGEFGPFKSIIDAAKFLIDSNFSWTDENMNQIVIEKESN